MAIDTTKKVKKITVDGTEMELAGGSGTSKLTQVLNRTVTEITAQDLAGITEIKEKVFYGCASLISIELPNTITYIATDAFNKCSSLPSITIPVSVTGISGYVFNNCTALTEMTILATTPPTLANTRAISSATTTIYIPAGTLSAYQTATNWSNFADKFVELSE